MWDLAVVGAGPCGSAAALAALARNPAARVLLLDRADFPRDKPCGDGIAPHALDVLAALGAPNPVAGFAPVSALRLHVGAVRVEESMDRAAYVVPRAIFDTRLVAAAIGAGACFHRHQVRRIECGPAAVVLDGEIAARVVVAADGANSVVRRLLGAAPRRSTRVALALRGYAPEDSRWRRAQVIAFGTGRWPSYAWCFPIGDGRVNVGYGELLAPGTRLTRNYLIERLRELLPAAAAEAGDWRAHHLPLSTGRPRQPDGRVLFAGDASSLINPLTGEGIYYAVLSGALAGRTAAGLQPGQDAGSRYRSALHLELGRHLRHTDVAARLASRLAVTERALRAARDPRVFQDLVELGLGRGQVTARLIVGVAKPARRSRWKPGVQGHRPRMTDVPQGTGPGFSPGADDADVTVVGGASQTIDTPVEEGAQELREEAARAREQGMRSRAEHAEGPSESAQEARQTETLDPSPEDQSDPRG